MHNAGADPWLQQVHVYKLQGTKMPYPCSSSQLDLKGTGLLAKRVKYTLQWSLSTNSNSNKRVSAQPPATRDKLCLETLTLAHLDKYDVSSWHLVLVYQATSDCCLTLPLPGSMIVNENHLRLMTLPFLGSKSTIARPLSMSYTFYALPPL